MENRKLCKEEKERRTTPGSSERITGRFHESLSDLNGKVQQGQGANIKGKNE